LTFDLIRWIISRVIEKTMTGRTSMSRFVIDETALRRLLGGARLILVSPEGRHELVMAPDLGWIAMTKAAIDAGSEPRTTVGFDIVEPDPWDTVADGDRVPDPPEAIELNDAVWRHRRGHGTRSPAEIVIRRRRER
jgi:hypothetical protein